MNDEIVIHKFPQIYVCELFLHVFATMQTWLCNMAVHILSCEHNCQIQLTLVIAITIVCTQWYVNEVAYDRHRPPDTIHIDTALSATSVV